jgi:chromatin structure-remodeling complex subunit RSC1/2
MPPPGGAAPANAYNPPRPPEVFTIADDGINNSIPEQVRNQFQLDENGRVLFFTAPPGHLENNGLTKTGAALGHTSRYLDGLEEWRAERERKRKERDERLAEETKKRRAAEEELAAKQKEAVLDQTSDLLAGFFQSHAAATKQMMGEKNGAKLQTEAQEAK